MKRLLPAVLLVYLLPSTAHAAPITVMRFSGAITEMPQQVIDNFVSDIPVGTWFVGSLWIDDDPNLIFHRAHLDLRIGNHHITGDDFPEWLGEDASYDWYHFVQWPGLTGGYVDSLFITAANDPFYGPYRKLFIQTVGVGRNYNPADPNAQWYQPFFSGTIYNVPEPSTILLLALGLMFARRRGP